VEADLEGVDLGSDIDAIICMGTICYLSDEGVRSVLKSSANCLVPGGRMLVSFKSTEDSRFKCGVERITQIEGDQKGLEMRSFSLSEIKREVKLAGLKIVGYEQIKRITYNKKRVYADWYVTMEKV